MQWWWWLLLFNGLRLCWCRCCMCVCVLAQSDVPTAALRVCCAKLDLVFYFFFFSFHFARSLYAAAWLQIANWHSFWHNTSTVYTFQGRWEGKMAIIRIRRAMNGQQNDTKITLLFFFLLFVRNVFIRWMNMQVLIAASRSCKCVSVCARWPKRLRGSNHAHFSPLSLLPIRLEWSCFFPCTRIVEIWIAHQTLASLSLSLCPSFFFSTAIGWLSARANRQMTRWLENRGIEKKKKKK